MQANFREYEDIATRIMKHVTGDRFARKTEAYGDIPQDDIFDKILKGSYAAVQFKLAQYEMVDTAVDPAFENSTIDDEVEDMCDRLEEAVGIFDKLEIPFDKIITFEDFSSVTRNIRNPSYVRRLEESVLDGNIKL